MSTPIKPFPHNLEAERVFLGTLIDDARKIDEARSLCAPEDMYNPGHERLYALLLELRRKGDHIDGVTVPIDVQRLGPDRYGGLSYIVTSIIGQTAPSAMAHYARQIRSDALRRKLISQADEIRERAFNATEDVSDVLADATTRVMALGADSGARSWRSLGEVAEALAERRRNATEGGGAFPTFFDGLDRMIDGGLHPGRVYIVAARPAMGKSALELQFAAAVAWAGRSVGLFSLEMDGEENVDRWFRSWPERTVLDWPIHIDDTAGLSIAEVAARSRRLKQKCEGTDAPLGMIGIDYLQLVDIETRRGATRAEAVGEVSRQVKILARSLKVPVVLLAQVNRECEKRTDKRPQVSDLKESGSIEQDADAVLLLYRDSVYSGASQRWDPVEVIVGKNRQGPTGMAPLLFCGPLMRFVEPNADDDAPQGCARAIDRLRIVSNVDF